ncbi:MAG: substrate-binding domain-containing protein [Kiritimatiellae bacterium]|nr:substrate-binding domain-containing protein [Kiritimatiellia bacterium]
MKKTASALILGALLALWLGAVLKGWVVPGESAARADVTLGFVLSTMQEERYQKDHADFMECAKELGAQVEFASAKNDGQIQIQKVEDILTKGVDVMVIQPVNSDTAKNLVSLCHAKGVPVIAYDRIIKFCDLDLYVTQDSRRVGVLQAEAAAQATGGKGRYAILKGTMGHSVAEEITRGNKEVLAKHRGIKIIFEQNHPNWAPNEALESIENMLTRENNRVDAILCNNSGMARGAIQALRKVNLDGKVFVAGSDADLDNCRFVLQGIQSVEVLKAIKPLARAAAEAAVRIAGGETAEDVAKDFATREGRTAQPADYHFNNGAIDVPCINTVVTLVTKENLEDVIVGSGFHPREKFADLLSGTQR